jgi:hypothetical protein
MEKLRISDCGLRVEHCSIASAMCPVPSLPSCRRVINHNRRGNICRGRPGARIRWPARGVKGRQPWHANPPGRGEYTGGFHAANLRGEAAKPIVIAAADPKQPPVFTGAKTGMHLANPVHVELRGLAFRGLSANGLNIDDGGNAAAPATEITLHGLTFQDIGARGNEDAIKLSWCVRISRDGMHDRTVGHRRRLRNRHGRMSSWNDRREHAAARRRTELYRHPGQGRNERDSPFGETDSKTRAAAR